MDSSFKIATLPLSSNARLGICGLPGFINPFVDDFAELLKWQPSHVVSMTETSEMQDADALKLGDLLAEYNIAWSHIPVRDFGGLEGANITLWEKLSPKLHAALDAGEGVLIHCKGGQGRSGMIALRLLVERGEEPEAALAKIRTVKPGAVETDEQFEWAAMR